jgi:hypothetical protein
MPGHGWTGVGGVIFVGAGAWGRIDFPVEAGIDRRGKRGLRIMVISEK